MKLSKVILLSTVCLFGYTEDVYSASHPAWDVSSRVFMSGIHTYHTHNILASDSLFSPSAHPRGVAESSPRLAPSTESAMLTSYLPSAQSSFSPTLREEYKEASVCFITDTSDCAGGGSFSPNETPGNGSGNPGGIPDYDTPQEQCRAAGYGVTSCPAGAHGDNPCPADSAYYQKCVCDANMTQTCTKPYYGVGPSCNGKYASCKRDDDKACREDGYNLSGSCPSLQTPNKRCPYNSSYYDKCVCRSDLVTCTSPQVGVGSSCGGKYESCCTPLANQTGCNCYSCSNGCGGIRQCCGTCHTHSYSCPNGYQSSPCGAGYQQIGTSSKSCSCGEISGICYKCSYSGSSGSEGGESGKDPTACIGSITALKKTDGGASWCASETPGSIIYPMCGCAYGCITVNGGTKITEYRYWRNPGGGKNYSTAERAACEAEAATLPCTGACR